MKTIKYYNRVETYNDKDELHSFNDNPAVDYNDGDKWWYKEDKLHRLNGPAIEWANGGKGWFYEGKHIICNSTEKFLKMINLKAFW